MLIKPEPARIEEVEPCHPNTDTQSNTIPVYEWITITAPENINDDDPSSSTSQAWRDVLGALAARKGCAGLAKYQCHWGRVLEDRCQMNILTFWVCKSSYEEYANGAAYQVLYEKLQLLSTSDIHQHQGSTVRQPLVICTGPSHQRPQCVLV
jgi:hypothetical protein